MMYKMQISLPEKIKEAIRIEADRFGFKPNVLAKIRLCTLFSDCGDETVKKTYLITLEKWKEIEAYIKVKQPGTPMEVFAAKAIFSEMKKHGLNSDEKREFEGLLGK